MVDTTQHQLDLRAPAFPDTVHALIRRRTCTHHPRDQAGLGFVDGRRPVKVVKPLGTLLTLLVVTSASAQALHRGGLTAFRVQASRDERCRALSSAYVAKAKKQWHRDYTLVRVEGFYSPILDACIHAESAEVGVYANIRDLSHTFFRENPLGVSLYCTNHGIELASCPSIPTEVLLGCDADGANSVIVDRVRKYRGWVDTLPYSEWQDDGFGGPPSSDKTPENPYTKEQCALLYDKWIRYVRGGSKSSRQ